MKTYDIIIIGAGASGIFAAGHIPQKKSVCVLDNGIAPLRRVAISGGGRCNFTNTSADYKHYFGKNPNFTRGALARFSAIDMLKWAHDHKIKTHEKSPGQFFCDDSKNIIDAMLNDARDTDIILNTNVIGATKSGDIFKIETNNGTYTTKNLCIATGGMSYPNISNGDIGYKIAKSFGHKIVPPRPALCGIKTNLFTAGLSGISVPAEIQVGHTKIYDNILFTHWGLGGPAIYRATVRDIENGFVINLLPNCDVEKWLNTHHKTDGRKRLKTILRTKMPATLAEFFANDNTKNIADFRKDELHQIATKIQEIKLTRNDFTLQKFDSAEITRGGIDTDDISSKTMESKLVPQLYFIGECIDIAGDLGGYNLQWAWASANAMAKNFEQ